MFGSKCVRTHSGELTACRLPIQLCFLATPANTIGPAGGCDAVSGELS